MAGIETDFDGLLQHPFSMVIAGATTCGKSSFTARLIQNENNIINNMPERVVYCYRIWNPDFENLPNVHFVKGLVELNELVDDLGNCLLVLDDVATEAASCKTISSIFTAGMHHQKISAIMIVHNLFMQAKFMREIMLNVSYLVLYRNVRDSGQIRCLETQTGLKGLLKAYTKVTKEKYSPLLVDLLPYTPDYARLRSNIFDKYQYVYVNAESLSK